MANILSTPLAWKRKSLFMKIEATYGDNAAPLAADWLEARNLSVTPLEASMVARNIVLPNKGRVGGLLAATSVKLGFELALAPSGTAGLKPKWDAVMQAAAFAPTTVVAAVGPPAVAGSVTYNLVSTAEQSATVDYYTDGRKQSICGVRGNWSLSMDAQGLPTMKFDGMGLYLEPVPNALALAPNKAGWTLEEPVGPLRTIGTFNGVRVAFSKYSVDAGHQVKHISLPGPMDEVVIQDRQPTAGMTILAPSLAALNPYALMTEGTLVTVAVTHGSVAGKRAVVTLQSRITGVADVDVDGYLAYDIKLEPEATAAGNDEIVLALT